MLKRDVNDTTRTRTVTILEEMTETHGSDTETHSGDQMNDDVLKRYSLDELTQVYDHRDVVLILSRDYELFCNELLHSNDGVVRAIANFVRL